MDKASVLPIAEKGVVGRGVLIDMARHRGKEWLDKGETFDHTDLEAAAAAQGVTIEPHDILCVRTGFMKYWYELNDKEKFYDGFNEPGLTYSRELVEWFQQREIPNLVTDTIANEVTYEPESGVALPLHCALMRNLGVALTEIVWLDDLADACAADGRWSFLYAAAPLKVVGGHGRAGQPDRHPLMGDATTNGRGCTSTREGQPHDITPEFTDALAMFSAGVARNPDGDAIRYFDGRITYRELDELTDAFAAALARRRACQRGDRVAIYLQNVPAVHHRAGRHVEGGRHRRVDQPDEPRAGARRCCCATRARPCWSACRASTATSRRRSSASTDVRTRDHHVRAGVPDARRPARVPRVGADHAATAPRTCWSSSSASAGRQPPSVELRAGRHRVPHLHLRHHGPAQGRDEHPRQRRRSTARPTASGAG